MISSLMHDAFASGTNSDMKMSQVVEFGSLVAFNGGGMKPSASLVQWETMMDSMTEKFSVLLSKSHRGIMK